MNELDDELSSLYAEIGNKEKEVSDFIKSCLGDSLQESERKMKEAEALVDKLNKRIIELNNGMNDFDVEVKQGMNQNPNNMEI